MRVSTQIFHVSPDCQQINFLIMALFHRFFNFLHRWHWQGIFLIYLFSLFNFLVTKKKHILDVNSFKNKWASPIFLQQIIISFISNNLCCCCIKEPTQTQTLTSKVIEVRIYKASNTAYLMLFQREKQRVVDANKLLLATEQDPTNLGTNHNGIKAKWMHFVPSQYNTPPKKHSVHLFCFI